MVWKADSTFDASSAEVSINESSFSAVRKSASEPFSHNRFDILAKDFASSVGTALKCFKSLLFPTSMITIFESA